MRNKQALCAISKPAAKNQFRNSCRVLTASPPTGLSLLDPWLRPKPAKMATFFAGAEMAFTLFRRRKIEQFVPDVDVFFNLKLHSRYATSSVLRNCSVCTVMYWSAFVRRKTLDGNSQPAFPAYHGWECPRRTARTLALRTDANVFEDRYPRFRLDAPARLLIIAAKDESTAKQLLPNIWAHPGPKLGGLFQHGWEREYALVRLDTINFDPDTYATIYHEYVHSLLHINFRWLPSWLDEGLAQFYGFTRFNDKDMYFGAPPAMDKIRFMYSEKPIPLANY